MKHITMKYGQEENLMELTTEELATLEPFLNRLGIRVRTTIYHTENGVGIQKSRKGGGQNELQKEAPQSQTAHGAAHEDQKLGGRRPHGCNLRDNNSGNPQIARLVNPTRRGLQPPAL